MDQVQQKILLCIPTWLIRVNFQISRKFSQVPTQVYQNSFLTLTFDNFDNQTGDDGVKWLSNETPGPINNFS